NLLVGFSEEELIRWRDAYATDNSFGKIINILRDPEQAQSIYHSQYFCGDNGLLYFEDWNGNNRLCVPNTLRMEVIAEIHDSSTESAHGG
ncbi:hypothetical protein F5879DRAFT_776302, partial [Lentinula edodes]